MKIGDLICFNGGGQKKKTLGLVIDFRLRKTSVSQPPQPQVLIQWCVIGKYMPRKAWGLNYNDKGFGSKIVSGDLVWHEKGHWFEVIK